MAEDPQLAARSTDAKRKYEDQSPTPPPATRRPTGFSAPITSPSPDSSAATAPPPSFNSVPVDEIQAAKQRAQEIAARLFSSAEAKRPRIENGGEDSIGNGFGSATNDAPVLSTSQERKLQAVRDHPEKDLGVLLPKESGGVSGPSHAPPAKRKVDRGMIGARLSSRNSPPSKAARIDNTTRGESSRVSTWASSPASPTGLPQPAISSAPIAIRESSSLIAPPAPHSCPPRPGAPAGAVRMLGKPWVIRERLGRFVIPDEVSQITSLGTERAIDTFLEGLAQASTATVSLMSKVKQLKRENESMWRELSSARKKVADFEADRGAFEGARERASLLETELSSAIERAVKAEGELLTARERESWFETALSLARERARRVEAELAEARERASLRETELMEARERASLKEAELAQAGERASLREAVVATEMKAACDRASQAEKELAEGVADAFIDGYEELRGKITAAFPDLDFSGFLPTEEPDETEVGEEDEEDDGGSHESS